jgi:hypothetical protein
LRLGTPILDCGEGTVQFGTDARWALRLTGLAAPEVAWLTELGARRHATLLRAADRHGVDPDRRDHIIAHLHAAGFLITAREVTLPGELIADMGALSALRADGAGGATMARRQRAVVGVLGLGRIGAAIALHLATAGVGMLVLTDPLSVQTGDVGLGAYRAADVGLSRRDRVKLLVAATAPRTTVVPDAEVDIVVLIDSYAADPARYVRLMGEAVPHLQVTLREADVEIGPLVVPGRSACVWCARLHRIDADPAWPAVAAQLRDVPAVPQETTLAASGAALAAAQVLAHLDGMLPVAAGSLLTIALPQAIAVVTALPPHPECGCCTPSR